MHADPAMVVLSSIKSKTLHSASNSLFHHIFASLFNDCDTTLFCLCGHE